MFFYFVKYKLDTIKIENKIVCRQQKGDSFCCFFAGFSRITNFSIC